MWWLGCAFCFRLVVWLYVVVFAMTYVVVFEAEQMYPIYAVAVSLLDTSCIITIGFLQQLLAHKFFATDAAGGEGGWFFTIWCFANPCCRCAQFNPVDPMQSGAVHPF